MAALEIKPLLVGVPDATRMLGLSRSTVWNMIRDGRLETRRIGARTLIPVRSIEAVAGEAA